MRKTLLAIAAAALAGVAPHGVAARAQAATTPAATPEDLLARLQRAWAARDLPAYLALWRFPNEEAREEASRFASLHFSADRSEISVQPPLRDPGGALKAAAQTFSVSEPRARTEESVYRLAQGGDGWAFVDREPAGSLDSLIHLSLDPQGFRADGLELKLVDFELRFTHGTLFSAPAELGPTLFVFVGEGTAHVHPQPPHEKEQLRQFAGGTELTESVSSAFIRIHPADLHRVLKPARLDPDPHAAARLPAALRLYREQAHKSFVLDAALPGSPWWLMPAVGDALVSFPTGRRGTLTYTLTGSAAEDVSLFDRVRRRQILLYPSSGRDTGYDEDDGRDLDVVHHDLKVRFDPLRAALEGEDTIRLKLLRPASYVQFRLDDALTVQSVRSKEGGEHLFLRVRQQDSVMVALGALSTSSEEVSLTIRYSGVLQPGTLEQEVQLQNPGRVDVGSDEDIALEPILIYTSQTSWYPRSQVDDYATAELTLNVPAGMMALTGGVRTAARTEAGRWEAQYRLERPGKYLSVAIGRLFEAGRREGPVRLQAYAVPRLRGEAERTLSMAAEILKLYQDEFGPCPYPDINLVLVEQRVPGGHSPPGMVVLAVRPLLMRSGLRDDPANFTEFPGFFLAHELAHQWWGQGVAGQNYRERWLSEGLAQYAAAQWVRHSQGERTFQRVLARMARWALQDSALGPINLGHRLGLVKGDPQIYRAVIYDKGAYVMHMLRQLVGDPAFQKGLIGYQEQNRYGKAGTDDLRRALEATSGRDLTPYFRQWVFDTPLPVLQARFRSQPSGASYRTTLDLQVAGLPGPVPLRVSVSAGQEEGEHTVMLAPTGGSFTFETAERPRRVEVNSDRGLLARVESR